jgi:hypothetical protein
MNWCESGLDEKDFQRQRMTGSMERVEPRQVSPTIAGTLKASLRTWLGAESRTGSGAAAPVLVDVENVR